MPAELKTDEQRETLAAVLTELTELRELRDAAEAKLAIFATHAASAREWLAARGWKGAASYSDADTFKRLLLDAVSQPKRKFHADATCGTCGGPLEMSRDVICERCVSRYFIGLAYP